MFEQMPDELPDEIREMLALQREQKQMRIEALGSAIAKKRDEAVAGRAASGIEAEWAEDEDAYQGIDNANRDSAKMYKSPGIAGTPYAMPKDPSRSSTLLNITRTYVDTAAARVADMLLPTDDRNWGIKPTPVPEIAFPVQGTDQPPAQALPGLAAPNGMQAAPTPEQSIEDAKKRAEKAEKRIEDWHVECQYHSEVRMVIEDCAKLGVGILKGPFPIKRKRLATKQEGGEIMMVIDETIVPASKRINPWNFYPHAACGDDISKGSYVFERDTITCRRLRDLKGIPGYLEDQIDVVLEEGPGKKNINTRAQTADDDNYEIWYFQGIIERDDLESMGIDLGDDDSESMPATVTIVNDRAIRAHLNPLDSGEYMYDVMTWQRREGHWAGIGVAGQIRTPQRMITAANRNMLDNAGLSGGPILGFRQNIVQPADGNWNIVPRKIFWVKEDSDARSVADAISAIIIPSNQAEMLNIIQFALKMAEDVTGLPQLLQGSMGNQAPDTVGGMQMVMNNASTVLRRIARTFDDAITEPHIRRYYQWIMEYGEEDEKGDFAIDARGSSALVERDIQNQAILQMGALVMNPAFKVDPEKWFAEACKAQRIDPKRFQLDDEQKARLAQMPQPEDPQITIAKIRAQVDAAKTDKEVQAKLLQIKMDTDRDTAFINAGTRRDQVNAASRMEELRLKRELAYLDLQIKKGIELDANKVKLADTSMKLRVQKELAFMKPQVATPPTEPPGRAQPGRAFEQ